MTLSCDSACAAFRPVFDPLIDAVTEGVEVFGKLRAHAAKKWGRHLNDRAQRTTLNSFVAESARRIFDGHRSVHPEPLSRGYETFRNGADFLFCIKKMNKAGVAVNHPSGQQDELRKGRQLRCFPAPHFVFVLYKLDPTLSEVQDVRLALPSGKWANHWSYSILDEVRGIREHPLLAGEAARETRRVVVKSRTRVRRRDHGGA